MLVEEFGMAEEEENKSVVWVIATVMVLIAGFGWGFMAGSYVGANSTPLSELSEAEREDINTRTPRRAIRGGMGYFIGNAIGQLPNMPAVISWHLSNRIWLPALIVLLEVGAAIGGWKMKQLEQELSKPYRPKGKKR